MRNMKVRGDFCPSCKKITEWHPIPDSLASFCECGFVRCGWGKKDESGTRIYDAGVTIQEWLEWLHKRSEEGEK